MADYATVNEIYGKRFPENPPARAGGATVSQQPVSSGFTQEPLVFARSQMKQGFSRRWQMSFHSPLCPSTCTLFSPKHPHSVPSAQLV